ncbi:MAG TPA: pyridoxal phosphate-dependent aminotransferase [Casimicrobiaceae bacterium]|nr:pyridoxal phosphate-dependent aminotransferase [Casimicrobiaceae bacterium]
MKQFEIRNRHFDRLFNTPGLMWLGQNTNHFSPHPAVVEAMHEAIAREEYHAYAPPAGFEELRALILEDLGLPEQSVLVTDGAVEALYNVCHTVCTPGSHFVTTDPGWKWPIHFAQAAGATITEIPIYKPESGYKLTVAQLESAVTDKTRLIYLVDPNNPLGTCYSRDEIEAFARVARRAGAYFMHDCTYAHFADEHTLAARFYPEGTFTIYSFSKWLGVAGLRVGAVVADPDLVERLAAAPPNNLGSNVISQRAAIAGLRTKSAWFPDINRRQRRNQAQIAKAVAKVPGMKVAVYPSQANFLVVECIEAGIKPEALCDAYREENIMIRQGTYHTPTFGHRFVKVSTTVPEAWADAFCERLPAMVEKARGITQMAPLF